MLFLLLLLGLCMRMMPRADVRIAHAGRPCGADVRAQEQLWSNRT